MSAVFAFVAEYAAFGFVMRVVAIGECKQIYGRKGMYGCGRDIPAVAKVSQMALLCGS